MLVKNRHTKKDVAEEGILGRAVIYNIKGSRKPLNMVNTPSSKGIYHKEIDVQPGVMVNTRLTQKLWPRKGRHASHISLQKRG